MSERMKDTIILLVIALIIILLNLPLLLGIINAKDSITFSYPYFNILKTGINNGSFPLWSHLLNYPVFAESQGGFAHPLHYILASLLPFWFSHNLSLLIHLLIGALFLYAYLRLIGLQWLSSFIGSLAFITSSQFSIHLGITPFIEGASYIPLFLYLIQRAEKGKKSIWYPLFALTGGLSLLCGHFQFALMGIGISLLYILVISKSHLIKRIFFIFIILAGIIAVASIQLLPSIELANNSNRAESEFDRFYESYNPIHLITYIDQTFFGTMPHPPAYETDDNIKLKTITENYWGSGSYFESTYFIGLIPFILAILSFFTTYEKEKKRLKWFFITTALIGLFFALGKFNPLSKMILQLPPLSLFRMPARYMFLTIISLSILSAFGFETLIKNKIKPLYLNLLIIFQIVYIIAIIILGLFINKEESYIKESLMMKYGERGGSALELSKEGYQKKIDILIERAKNSINIFNPDRLRVIIITAIFICAIVILRKSKGNVRKITIYSVFLLTLFDILSDGLIRESVIPYWKFKPPEIIKSLESNDRWNIFSTGWDIPVGKEAISTDMIIPNANALFGFSTPLPRLSYEYSATASIRELVWLNLYEAGSGDYPFRRFKPTETPKSLSPLEMLSVRYLITTHPINSDRASLMNRIDNEGALIYVYTLSSSPQIIYAPERAIHIRDNEEFEGFITGDDYKAGKDIVLIDGGDKQETISPGNVTIDKISDNAIGMTYNGEGGYIATSMLSYPGWRCYIDGVLSKIETVFSGLISIPVQSGKHSILLKYEPGTFTLGLYISALTTLIIVLIIILLFIFRRKIER